MNDDLTLTLKFIKVDYLEEIYAVNKEQIE